MSGCTGTAKPKIAILMAVYEPRMDWLREQLESLNAQTYPNLELYIRDDCSPKTPYADIEQCVRECITNFPYTLMRNEENVGSNRTFERLTQEAEGDFFAYCDQDDIWLPEKLTVLEEAATKSNALLVCSDMYVIDGDGKQIADSITKVRRQQRLLSGDNLAEGLIFHNFVTGCTMLVSAMEAKTAVPFCPYMVHDQYLALWCAERGSIVSVKRPLIRYRLHGSNQTGLLAGVTDKKSYKALKISKAKNCAEWLKVNFPCEKSMSATIENSILWATAREKNWKGQGEKRIIWKYRRFHFTQSIFELLVSNFPECLFKGILGMIRRI